MRLEVLLACFLGPPAGGSTAKPSVPRPRVTQPWLALQHEQARDGFVLEPLSDGRYRYVDREGGFVAYIRPDGSVEFRRGTSISAEATDVRGWGDEFVEALQRPRGQRDRADLESMPSRDDVSGRAAANMQLVPWGPYGPAPILISMGVALPGISKWGPSVKAQREFLRQTEAMRDALAIRWREAQLERETARVTRRIVEIWRDETLSLAKKKRLVFELWEEAEPATPPSDARLELARAKAAATVRRRIEAAIRRLAPSGSPGAYTREELEAFNARRGDREVFAPYHPADDRH